MAVIVMTVVKARRMPYMAIRERFAIPGCRT